MVVGTIVGDDVGLLLGENDDPFWCPMEWLLLTDGVGVVVLVIVVMSNEGEGSDEDDDDDEEEEEEE